MNHPRPIFALYARRSSDSDDKQTLSIPSQLDELRKTAARRGIAIAKEFTESGSAREPGRPVFRALMRDVGAGRITGILVWRLDRLARNMVDGGEIIYELAEGRLKEIVTPEATYTGSPDAKFMLAMLFGAAAKYTDDLSAAVRRGNQDVLRKGKVPGPVPLGYVKTHEHELVPGSGTVIPDPERFELVKRLWQEVLGGATNMSDLWRKARNDWGLTTRPTKGMLAHPIALTNIYAILRNPFYAGKIRRGQTLYKGEHPPTVTWEQFERVQDLLGRDEKSAPRATHEFLLQGVLRCGACGRGLTGERHEKHGHTYVYYRCSRRRAGYYVCRARAVREDEIVAAIAEVLDAVVIDPMIREWAFEAVAWWAAEDEVSPEKLAARAKYALGAAESKLATLTDMAIDGHITQAEYMVLRTNQLAKINHLREALADPMRKLEAWRLLRDEKRKHGLKLGEEFRAADAELQRRIVMRTCSEISVADGRPQLILRSPFVLRGAAIDQPVAPTP